jgi:uncharacterized protein with HEPN domain
MFPSQIEFLHHILDEYNFLRQYQVASYDELLQNKTLSHAFYRSLEIIREATRHVHPDLKSKYPLVDWREIAGMRDKIIHDYFGIDYALIWETVKTDIPILKEWWKLLLQIKNRLANLFLFYGL